ncbi:hypothetical protein C2869_21285 [Saccharobesus litoralis]|uniref:Metallo-peptidase family M12B Reprolysin-like n=1 Tax=Saccharobesus litoralis TaxID=2172099 RepID=A0A2S0VX66_9ALTE|nr:tandem-95 repeat protein [Saccharobesus litoralis]AWB68775.1 hypothetical protein C2869_21285 [Saccharobesus litoralis]
MKLLCLRLAVLLYVGLGVLGNSYAERQGERLDDPQQQVGSEQNVKSVDWHWQVIAGHGGTLTQQDYPDAKHFIVPLDEIIADLKALYEDSLLNSSSQINVTLPTQDGQGIRYQLSYDPVYSADFTFQHPDILTFKGHAVDNPILTGRFDIGPLGFNGMYQVNGETWYLDAILDSQQRQVLYPRPKQGRTVADQLQHISATQSEDEPHGSEQKTPVIAARGSYSNGGKVELTTYRIAISTTGEYTQYFGDKSKAINAIVTTLNRVNAIYQRDLAIRLALIANNQVLVSEHPDSDPFENSPTSRDLRANQQLVDREIGVNNYDLGHVFMTGSGGLATIGSVCHQSTNGQTGFKAQSATGLSNPIGDAFAVEYVAHEIAHQFGALHTYNGTMGSCAGQRAANAAYEPGSGSTIMSYAGICGAQNLQYDADDYFHSISIDQINDYIRVGQGASCGTTQNLNNKAPLVSAGNNQVIPALTPFVLHGQASDHEGDVLWYSWEQFDLGEASNSVAQMKDVANKPIFRAWPLTQDNFRYFPRLEDVVAGRIKLGESYPNSDRDLTLRLIVRDGQGGVDSDTRTIKVIKQAGPFQVTSPSRTVNLQGNSHLQLNWDVARTNQPPISCQKVDIILSNDKATKFDNVLASQVANSGAYTIDFMPNQDLDNGRLMVKCSSNVFFALTPAALNVQAVKNLSAPKITRLPTLQILEDQTLHLTLSDFYIVDQDSTHFKLLITSGANYRVENDVVIPEPEFSGKLNVNVQVFDGELYSEPTPVSVTVLPVNDAPIAVNDFVAVAFGDNLTLDVIANDVDPEQQPLHLLAVNYQGQHNLQINGNTLSFSSLSQQGIETFSYQVSDGELISQGQVQISVLPLGLAPVNQTQAFHYSIDEDTHLTLDVADFFSGHSSLDGTSLVVESGDNYRVEAQSLIPNRDFHGGLTAQVSIYRDTVQLVTYPISVQVNAVNDAPIGHDDSVTINQGERVLIPVLNNDWDSDSNSLRIAKLDYQGAAQVQIIGDDLEYNASDSFSGLDIFTYTLSDEQGATSQVTVRVTVLEANLTTTRGTEPVPPAGGGLAYYYVLWFACLLVWRKPIINEPDYVQKKTA